MDQTLLTYVLLSINGLLALSLLSLMFLHRKMVKKSKDYLTFQGKVKDAERFILDAQIEARETLLKASNKSTDIVKKAELFKGDLEGSFETALKESFNDIRREVAVIFKRASEDFSSEAKRDMQTFSANLHSETENIKGIITEGITSAIKKAEEEVDEYRAERMKNIDKEIKERVDSISKEILGKSLDIEDHLKLVTESLGKAKRENVL
jgi:hypothetical protein